MRLTDDQLARAIEDVGQQQSGAIFARMPEGIDDVDDLYEILSELHELRENANGGYDLDARAVWRPVHSIHDGLYRLRWCRHCSGSVADDEGDGWWTTAYQDARFVCNECYGKGLR